MTGRTNTGGMMRSDGRTDANVRDIKIETRIVKFAEGSCLFEMGGTKVICTARVEDGVPHFLRGKGTGWVTSEYGMLPGSCPSRVPREASIGRKGGRTHEIQRLIGRSIRSVLDLDAIGERTIWLDCDVIQADGGTRCASISGSFVALCLALEGMKNDGIIDDYPLKDFVSAVSVGIVRGKNYLDLSYEEDSKAEVDMNVVMTSAGKFIEVQGTAEKKPFSREQMDKLLGLAEAGIKNIIKVQRAALKGVKI